jgi:transcriptional regulator with XRE-family HTH domain
LESRKVLSSNLTRLILRKIRQKEFNSIEHFAKSTGIQKSLLSRILNEKADPKLSSLEKIAQALEVPVAELIKTRAK